MSSSVDSSMTMSDRLLMEPTFDMDDEEVMEREESGENENVNKEPEANNLDCGEVGPCDRVVTVGDQEELEELEQSLQALERLDRSSPDLWPDQVDGL